jgi:hypothetical protein
MKFAKGLILSSVIVSSLATSGLSVAANTDDSELLNQDVVESQENTNAVESPSVYNSPNLGLKDGPISYAVQGPPLGQNSTSVVYISNGDLGLVGGGYTGSTALLSDKIKQKIALKYGIRMTGAVGNIAMVVAAINHVSGGNGFKITSTLTYTMVRPNPYQAPYYVYQSRVTNVSRY